MSKAISWIVLIYWELGFLIYFISFDIIGKTLSLILMAAPIVYLYNRKKVIVETVDKRGVEDTVINNMELECNEENGFVDIEIETIQDGKFEYFVD